MPEEPFVVTSLAPDDVEPPTDDELLDDLELELGQDPSSDELVVMEDEVVPIGRSWAFDFTRESGRFATSVTRSPLATHGTTTLIGWVQKCLVTAREAHPIHPPGYGMEDPFYAVGRPLDGDPTLGDRIRDALIFHDRIDDVRDVVIDSDPDDTYLLVSFTLVLDDSTVLPLTNVRIG